MGVSGRVMTAPQALSELVDHFRENRTLYRGKQYNETQIRREFIDPMFELLGWDLQNRGRQGEAYKDVIHEDAIRIAGTIKAPDYAFRIGGTRKFFLEAKKPAVNIKDDASPAFQLKRYAWSAKLPLSILTDFEEFAVYDCRFQPKKTDGSEKARHSYFTYEDYEARWDEIAADFSRNAVLNGSIERIAEQTKRKRGTTEVDEAFLAEIEKWRASLARNIALRNSGLSVRALNTAVQQIIDRLIFLRIAEDRGIEQYGSLLSLKEERNSYAKLCKLFIKADDRYNSGLFHFRKSQDVSDAVDTVSLGLSIDDKVIKDIVGAIYYPDSPYEFSVIGADILGQVYEQFLGKVINLSGTRASVVAKPDVKKAGGVYYTPTYIVKHLVSSVLNPLLQGKSPAQVSGLDGAI